MIQENTQNIQTGDSVMVTLPWTPEETADKSNFKFGTVTNVFHKDMGDDVKLLKFEVTGTDRVFDADRIKLIAKGNIRDLAVWVPLTETNCAAAEKSANAQGLPYAIIANNFDRTEFEVMSGDHSWEVKFKTTEFGTRGTCDCPNFQLTNKRFNHHVCRHIGFVAMKELFTVAEPYTCQLCYAVSVSGTEHRYCMAQEDAWFDAMSEAA